ncbi:NUDIX hydrolase [Paenibacillus sp. D2_2]|uniref:NUDIX hydrolase n=1 Tax=Paenibacillus sp. D2_2 TaxID=3073092 RepID=UPI00281696B1|nr:NUDIX hydrolase [Paenibacillus sp. D2_2]WMT39662.1 NUDIX hydrolase [Paenibacillus sp. D2_2]
MQTKWIEWAKQIQAISQAGLTYSKDVYDIERFEQLRTLSIEILNEYTDVDSDKIRNLFANEMGYPTPKVDVRGVIFKDNQILLVRERADGAWSLPGGWADIGLSSKEVVVKEVKEESGLDVIPVKLLGLIDKKFYNHPPSAFHVYKVFILCEIVGGQFKTGIETEQVGFFEEEYLPDLSKDRNTIEQIQTLFEMMKNPNKEIMFD